MPEMLTNLGGAPDIRTFVDRKIDALNQTEQTFDTLFPLMFSEKENTFYEWSSNLKIRKMTYGEAYEEVLKRSRILCALLPPPAGRVVGLSMENGPMWIVNFWAILRSGYCPLLMNRRLDRETLEDALKTLNAAAVVTDGERFSVLTIEEEKLSSETISDREIEGAFGDTFFVMSSGTSEHVKLCAYTAKEVFSILNDSRAIVGESPSMQRHYNGELKQLAFLPFYHIFGFVAVYLWFAFYSRTFVALPDLQPETVLSTIRRHEVTHIFAVPLFWEKVYTAALKTIRQRGEKTYRKFLKGLRIAARLENSKALSDWFSKRAFREVRKNLFGESISFLISGGSRLDPETGRFFNRVGYHFAEGYGMSEIGIAGVNLSEKPAERNTGSVGKPFTSYRYEIRDGELFVNSRSMAAYVLKDGTRQERPDWFPTGDLAEKQKDGYVILGRTDDLIVGENGENLNPNLVEPKLVTPGVREMAVIRFGEDGKTFPVLLISVSPYLDPEGRAAIEQRLRSRINDLKLSGVIRKILMTADPLITGNEFKVNRKRIEKRLASGGLHLLSEAPDRNRGVTDRPDALRDAVIALVADALDKPKAMVGYETDFFMDEGGSSIDYLFLQGKIRNTFDVLLPNDFGTDNHSVRTMERYIRNEINGVDTFR